MRHMCPFHLVWTYHILEYVKVSNSAKHRNLKNISICGSTILAVSMLAIYIYIYIYG